MPYPHLRPDETRRETPGPTPGVLVITPDGKRFFFPGGTPDLGLILARGSLGADLDDPRTRSEFGTRDGSLWQRERLLKAPAGSPPEPPPRTPAPGDPDWGWGGSKD